MDASLVGRRIRCPYCAEPMEIVLDLSAGGQSYVEDCQVCCRPNRLSIAWDEAGECYTADSEPESF